MHVDAEEEEGTRMLEMKKEVLVLDNNLGGDAKVVGDGEGERVVFIFFSFKTQTDTHYCCVDVFCC